jgi:hypothetical protein
VRLQSLADYAPPFGVIGPGTSSLIEIGHEHFVRATTDTSPENILP